MLPSVWMSRQPIRALVTVISARATPSAVMRQPAAPRSTCTPDAIANARTTTRYPERQDDGAAVMAMFISWAALRRAAPFELWRRPHLTMTGAVPTRMARGASGGQRAGRLVDDARSSRTQRPSIARCRAHSVGSLDRL